MLSNVNIKIGKGKNKNDNTGYRLEKLELSLDLFIFRVTGSQGTFLGGVIFYYNTAGKNRRYKNLVRHLRIHIPRKPVTPPEPIL